MRSPTSKQLEPSEQQRLDAAVRVTEALLTEADRIAAEREVMGFPGPRSEFILLALASSFHGSALVTNDSPSGRLTRAGNDFYGRAERS